MVSISLIPVGLVCLAAFGLLLVILLNNPSRFINQVFAALCGLGGLYPLVNFLSDHNLDHALFWSRGTFLISALMLICVFLFAANFPHRSLLSLASQVILVMVGLVVAIITMLPVFVPAVTVTGEGTDVVTGPIYVVFIAFVILYLMLSFGLMWGSLRRATHLDRRRIHYVIAGFFITAGLLTITNLLLPFIQGNNMFSSWGSYFIVIFVGFSAAAILRQRLFDIRLLVARSMTYVLVLGTLAAIYSALIFGVSNLFFVDAVLDAGQKAVYTAIAVVVAFTFQPLRRFFDKLTDRFFYHYSYNSQEVLQELTKIMAAELDLGNLLDRALGGICRDLHIAWGQFIVFDQDKIYKIAHHGSLPKKLITAPFLRQLNRTILVADELEAGERKVIMDDHGIRVSAVLRTKDQFVGFLLLGDKLSGDIYSGQDLDVLQILAGEMAVAATNAKAYEQIAHFNVTLQEKIRAATHDLRGANRHLKDLDQAKDEFISMASHQLRTPLTTVKGYLSMLLEGDAGELKPQQREFLGYAFTGSERMVGLISDLLNVSRLAAGKFMIERQPTDLVTVTTDEVQQLIPHAKAKKIDLVFEPPAQPLPLVNIDEGKTRQVIMNFIDNAVYYTPRGSVTVRLSQNQGRVKLEVTDTGIGVPPAARAKLFSKFYRADNAQTVRPDGTGLGLYLAKRVIEDQGGTIIFDSTEGKGSTFGFELPPSASLPATASIGAT